MAMCNAQQIKSGVFDALHTTVKHVPDVCNLNSKYRSVSIYCRNRNCCRNRYLRYVTTFCTVYW